MSWALFTAVWHVLCFPIHKLTCFQSICSTKLWVKTQRNPFLILFVSSFCDTQDIFVSMKLNLSRYWQPINQANTQHISHQLIRCSDFQIYTDTKCGMSAQLWVERWNDDKMWTDKWRIMDVYIMTSWVLLAIFKKFKLI